MKTDIQIAQEATLKPIQEIAAKLDLSMEELELYGKYKAKISDEYLERIKGNKDGKLVLVTAITPTKAGEGKTTTSIALHDGFAKINQESLLCLREPSLVYWISPSGETTGIYPSPSIAIS